MIDLGHSHDVLVEHRGPVIRVWEDGGERAIPDPNGPHIDIPRHTLPSLLGEVQQDLAGFLTALHPWAQTIRPGLADPLTAAVDSRLQISADLNL